MKIDNLLKFKLLDGDYILVNKYNIIYIFPSFSCYEILIKMKENLTERIKIDAEYYQNNYLSI